MQLTFSKEQSGATYHVQVKDEVFAVPYRPALVHQVVNALRARARQGTRAQKRRSGGARAAGTSHGDRRARGRARAGTLRSPLWRGGGVTFARAATAIRAEAQPQDVPRRESVPSSLNWCADGAWWVSTRYPCRIARRAAPGVCCNAWAWTTY